MKIVAIIPARGGSRGIPLKNLQVIDGKSLLMRTIEAALEVRAIERIVVSTDSLEIETEALRCGAEVIRRPGNISGDAASSELALLQVLESLAKSGYVADILVFLQCTAPFTTSGDICGALELLSTTKADTVFSAIRCHLFLWRESDGDAMGINHNKYVRPMRQDRSPEFIETGAIYVMRAGGFLRARHRFFGRTAIYQVPDDHWLEVDDPLDLLRARALIDLVRRQDLRSVLHT